MTRADHESVVMAGDGSLHERVAAHWKKSYGLKALDEGRRIASLGSREMSLRRSSPRVQEWQLVPDRDDAVVDPYSRRDPRHTSAAMSSKPLVQQAVAHARPR